MTITAICACQAQIQAPDQLAGRSVKCPKCKASVPIPAAGDGQSPGPAPNAGNGQTGYSGAGISGAPGNGGSRQADPPRSQSTEPPGYAGAQRAASRDTAGAQNPGPGGSAGEKSSRQANFREDGEIPADLKERVLNELNANEQIVWMGKPVPSIILVRNSVLLIVGAVVLIGSLFLLAGGKTTAAAAVGIIIGTGMLLAPILKWQSAQRTCYALTNRRAIVVAQGMAGISREVYSPAEVARMQRHNCLLFGGAGDLVFHTVTTVSTSYTRQAGYNQSVNTKRYGFLAIERVDEVERLVRETLIDRFVDRLTDGNSL